MVNSNMKPIPSLAISVMLICQACAQSRDQSAVFREVTYSYGAQRNVRFVELDPDTKRVFTGEHLPQATMKRHVPKLLTLDINDATKAEMSVEYWGGHIGTAGQQLRVNDHAWVDLPQPIGMSTEPQRYFRVLLGNNTVPVPLEHLKQGENTVRFAAGKQIAYSFDWGMYWIYGFTARIFYDAQKFPHPTGEFVRPKPHETFGDVLNLEVDANSENSTIERVEFIGEYDDYDWDGDGKWREWQYCTDHGVMHHHLWDGYSGTMASSIRCDLASGSVRTHERPCSHYR